jgi:PAS domain S-box-containing protein
MDLSVESNQLLNNLPCGYIITSNEGLILYANQFILNLLQKENRSVVGKQNIKVLFSDGVKIYFETHLQPILNRTGKLESISLEVVRSDDTLVAVLVNVNRPDSIEEEKVYHYTFFDSTQIKKSESELLFANQIQNQLLEELKLINENYALINHQLEESEVFYKKQSEIHKHISEAGLVGGWELDLVKDELIWSEMTKKIYEIDIKTQPTLQQGISFIKDDDTRMRIRNVVIDSIKTGKPFDEEMQIVTAKGNEVWIRALGFVTTTKDRNIKLAPAHSNFMLAPEDDGEQTISIFGTFQDIDEQKKMILLLEKSNISIANDNKYLKSIVENNLFYIVRTDLEGNYTYCNPYYLETFGGEAKDWIGKSSMDSILPEDHKICLDTIYKCFANPDKSHLVILRKPTKSGINSIEWEFLILKDAKGNFTEILCIGYEITPLLKKQEELISLLDITSIQNIRLQNFTHTISHNIRSHVANLKGIISITDLEKFEDRKMAWELIVNTVSSLDETIHNLNEIIGIQSQKKLEMVNVNISTEINKVLQGINLLMESCGVQIFYDFDENDSLITNATYFENIFSNLISNSIKYKSAYKIPEIHISYFQKDKYKVICVKDNGLGINLKRHSDKLFGMYNTFHGNNDAKGLGLFIIKTQIEALGGKIEVESMEGEGTAFYVYFLQE